MGDLETQRFTQALQFNSDDYLQTNIYASTTPFEDLVGLQPHLITSTSNPPAFILV